MSSSLKINELRGVVRAELECDDARIDYLIRVHRRSAKQYGAEHDAADVMTDIWIAHRDPSFFGGTRGPKPKDPLARALQVAAERHSAKAADSDWDASTPAAIEAAEILADAIASSWGRGRRHGTRPQVERRAAARRVRAAEIGQAGFDGLGWGMPE